MNLRKSKLAVFSRLMLVAAFVLAILPNAEVTFAAPLSAPSAAPAAAPAAALPDKLFLKVKSARAEPNWPGAANGIVKEAPVANFKYIINEDNTGDPTQARGPQCSTADVGYPDNCNWPSIHTIQGSSPIYAQGDQSDFDPITGEFRPGGQPFAMGTGRYLISVQADNFKIDGEHFTVPLTAPTPANAGNVTVHLQPFPLPLATIRIQVFEDNYSTNGQFDVPGEHGLAGFEGHIFDVLAEVTTDWFGNPICSRYETEQGKGQFDANGTATGDRVKFGLDGKPIRIAGTGGKCVSIANGQVIIPNVGPNRYTAQVVPPLDPSTVWSQTTTLEGNHDFDVWVQENATGYDTEFVGPNGEPVPAIPFGYVKKTNLNAGPAGVVKGHVNAAKTYIPQTGGVPLNNQDFSIGAGTRVAAPIDRPWVALSDLRNGDVTVYAGRGNPDGSFSIPNVPDSDYTVAVWDQDQNFILELRQVTVANGQTVDMGTVLLAGWWTYIEGTIFFDTNGNGKQDPGETGVANQVVTIKTRNNSVIDRGSATTKTDSKGHYIFPGAYPLTSWVIVEVYNDRFKTTGVTYQADNQPNETTVLGGGVDVSVLPIIGLSGRLDWGVKFYNNENGGIVGTVSYDTTRNELDPRFAAVESYQPGIPGLEVRLYAPVPDGSGGYVKANDGSYKLGNLLQTYTTETWQRPTDCTPRDVSNASFTLPVLPTKAHAECLEAPFMGVQFQSGFSTVDGNYGFGGLQPGDYLVKVVIPDDKVTHRPLYKVTKEEDVNVFNGDQFTTQIPPPVCAGALHTVDVKDVLPDGPNAVENAGFAAGGGSPYEGQARPLCDMKLVRVQNNRSIAPTFNFFTDVPVPGKLSGLIVDDLNVSSNPQDILYGEKRGVPNAPIGIYDYTDRLVTTIQSDPNGVFEVLLPSTSSYNCPLPAGPCSNVYRFVGNDPGQPGKVNGNYNPQYRTISASFEVWPGLWLPADLAPTTVGTQIAIPGSQFNAAVQCKLEAATPQIFAVSKPYAFTSQNGVQITIDGQGFGANRGSGRVRLSAGNVNLSIATYNTWNDRQIKITLQPNQFDGIYQLNVTANNGQTSINGLSFHMITADANGYSPDVYEVGGNTPGVPQFATIQAAINKATADSTNNEPKLNRKLVVVYPGPTSQFNPLGVYYENLLINTPIKLQGVGPGGVRADNTQVRGSILDGLGFEQVNGAPWRARLATLQWSGLQTIAEGAVITVLANNTGRNRFTSSFPAGIDGLTIQGGDQLGTPNRVNSLPGGAVTTQGGGIYVNNAAHNLQITNNIIRSNGGAYGGAVRLGSPYFAGSNLAANKNDNIRIANNRLIANGGTNLAGGVGIFTGADNYEIANNDICGNYSAEYGGGISHFGLSPNGKIHDNRIYFNNSYDEGGGIMIAGELPANPTQFSAGSGSVDIYNNMIQANLANDDGGGIRFLQAGNFPINIYNNMIVNNVSTHEGGGIALDDATNVRIYNNTIMKNITTATAATSNGLPAPAGISSGGNSSQLQALLPGGSPAFSKPLLFNNILWDNRAGTFNGVTLVGLGLAGDPNPINNWDMGVADGIGVMSPTYSILQVTTGTDVTVGPGPTFTVSGNNIIANPNVKSVYDLSVQAFPWRGNARFVGVTLLAVEAPANLLGDYHLKSNSPAIGKGVNRKQIPGSNPAVFVNAPLFDFDRELRVSLIPLDNKYDIGADEYRP